MRASHTNVCDAVRFIPDRPSEILSAGYDSTLLHFDVNQGSLLSRFDVAGPPPSGGMSLSPPFVHCVAFSEHGAVAASTADGRVWVGRGGDKSAASKKKRHRKWEGLREDEGNWVSVAEGPVVSVGFIDPESFVTCTLLGSLSQWKIGAEPKGNRVVWSRNVGQLEKVNCMRSGGIYLAVAGFSSDSKGLVEVYGR